MTRGSQDLLKNQQGHYSAATCFFAPMTLGNIENDRSYQWNDVQRARPGQFIGANPSSRMIFSLLLNFPDMYAK